MSVSRRSSFSTIAKVAIVVLLGSACAVGDETDASDHTSASTSTTEAPTSGCGRDASSPGTERLDVRSDDITYEVERVVPPTYDATEPAPLVVDLHGFTSTIEQQNLFSDLPAQAGARGYIVLTPQAEDSTLTIAGEQIAAPFWNVTPGQTGDVVDVHDDVAFLTRLIETTESELCVDDERIFITGNSNGAAMSAVLACEMPGRIAAIAPVSGINVAPECGDLEPLSVIAFHGDADPLVEYGGGRAAGVAMENPSVEARVGEFADAAECDPEPEKAAPFDDIEHRRWTGCRPGLDVELFTVLGGGHTWPGMLNYVDATKLAEISGGDQRLIELTDVDIGQVAGHMTVNLEATSTMLDFFDAHPRAKNS